MFRFFIHVSMMIQFRDMTNSKISGDLGRHLEFLYRLSVDSRELSICCRGWHILKLSACYEFVRGFTHIDLNTLDLFFITFFISIIYVAPAMRDFQIHLQSPKG